MGAPAFGGWAAGPDQRLIGAGVVELLMSCHDRSCVASLTSGTAAWWWGASPTQIGLAVEEHRGQD